MKNLDIIVVLIFVLMVFFIGTFWIVELNTRPQSVAVTYEPVPLRTLIALHWSVAP